MRCKKEKAFVFVIHNPRVFRDGRRGISRMKQLIDKTKRVFILGLGPHIAEVLDDYVTDWGRSISTDYIIPIFPIDRQALGASREMGFVLQGSIHSMRRKYKGILEDVKSKLDMMSHDFKLIVLGNGNISISDDIRSAVSLRQNEKYPQYYSIIQNNIALLTAFASGVYYKEKASSSVAASLICRTPLLTSAETLRTYSYLSPSSVWLQEPEESELDAMLRILETPNFAEAFRNRFMSVDEDFNRAIERNRQVAAKVVQAITAKS